MSYKMKPDPPLTNGNLRDKIENFKEKSSDFIDMVVHPITGNYRMDKIPYVGVGGFKKAGEKMTKKLKQSSARIKSSTERLKSAKARYKAAKTKVNKK
tara:strand:+ start:312 stop:605 length:294 start_codon:yes stop_codon:yes gene_type:complete